MPPDPHLRRAWHCFTDALHLEAPLSEAVWRAVERSAHPHAQALKYHLGRLQEQPTPARTWAAFGQGGALEARRLVELLDMLVAERRLDRAAASRFQDGVLQCMDKHGVWR